MRGAILAAGLGTRLRPLTTLRPKPLVPIVGRALIEFALDSLAGAGIREVGVNAFHLADQIEPALAHRAERIEVVAETELLGTGGGIRGISRALGAGPLTVVNGDALFDFQLAPLLAEHRRSGALATLVLREVPLNSPFGRVGVDSSGKLHRIAEVVGPDADRQPLRYGAFTGVQFVEQALIDAIPDGHCDILRSAYRASLGERALLRGVFAPTESQWIDVGTVDRYLAANFAVLEGRLPGAPPCRVHPSVELGAGVEVASEHCVIEAGVQIGAGARIGPNVWLGAGVRVAPGAHLRHTAVWPGAAVEGDHDNAVCLPG